MKKKEDEKIEKTRTRVWAWLKKAPPYLALLATVIVAAWVLEEKLTTTPTAAPEKVEVSVPLATQQVAEEPLLPNTEEGAWRSFCVDQHPHYRNTVQVRKGFSVDGHAGKAIWCAMSTKRSGQYAPFGTPLDWAQSDGNVGLVTDDDDASAGGAGTKMVWAHQTSRVEDCKNALYRRLQDSGWNYPEVIKENELGLFQCIIAAVEHKHKEEEGSRKYFKISHLRNMFWVNIARDPNDPAKAEELANPMPATPPDAQVTTPTPAPQQGGVVDSSIVFPGCDPSRSPTISKTPSGGQMKYCLPTEKLEVLKKKIASKQ